MAEDWSTINVTRERAMGREVDLLRRQYAEHREALGKLAANAPTEVLAREYVRLQGEIDQAIARLADLERGSSARNAPPPASPPTISDTARSFLPPVQLGNEPAEPLSMPAERGNTGRILLIAASAAIVLAVLGYLVWKRSAQGPGATTVQEVKTTTNATAISSVAPPVPAPAVAATPRSLSVTPVSFDYGRIRKGTRAVHKFELVNSTARPIPLAVSRAACRCLWFQYARSIPANGRITLGVTVDGARAKKGSLKETVTVSASKDPQISASFDLTANVQ
jgi:hypothetical protein